MKTVKVKGYYNLIFIKNDPCVVFMDHFGEQEVINLYYNSGQNTWYINIKGD